MSGPSLRLPLLALLLAVAPTSHARAGDDAGERLDLRPRFRPGVGMRYTQKRRTTLKGPGISLSKDFEVDYRLKGLRNEKPGPPRVRLTIAEIASTVKKGAEALRYDSRKPREASSDARLGVLVESARGQALDLLFAESGKLRAIEDGEKIYRGERGAFLDQFASRSELLRQFGSLFTPAPGRDPARVGESWERREEIVAQAGLRIRLDWKMTLRSLVPGRATIDLLGQATLVPSGEAGDAAARTKITAQELRGTLVFDRVYGVLRQQESLIALTFSVPAAGDERAEMTLRQTVDLRLRDVP